MIARDYTVTLTRVERLQPFIYHSALFASALRSGYNLSPTVLKFMSLHHRRWGASEGGLGMISHQNYPSWSGAENRDKD